jgi:hypothetical protein
MPTCCLGARECLSRFSMPPRLIVVGHINVSLSVRLSVRPGLPSYIHVPKTIKQACILQPSYIHVHYILLISSLSNRLVSCSLPIYMYITSYSYLKVYQLLAHDRWFSPGIPASSTTKTGRYS